MSTAFGSFVESRFDPSPRTLVLAAGDLLVIAVFVSIGELQHAQTDPLRAGMTLLSFLIGWGVGATLLGAYSPRATRSARPALAATAGAWILADVIAQGLRATSVFPGDAALTFALVALLFGLLLLLPWRAVAARFA